MNAPKTLDKFITLLGILSHRERLCFPLRDGIQNKYAEFEATTLEVYVTSINGGKQNVNFKITTKDGKVVKNQEGKVLLNKSRYFNKCTVDFLENFYIMIGGNAVEENV